MLLNYLILTFWKPVMDLGLWIWNWSPNSSLISEGFKWDFCSSVIWQSFSASIFSFVKWALSINSKEVPRKLMGKFGCRFNYQVYTHFQQHLNQEEWSINYLHCQGSDLGDFGTKGVFISGKRKWMELEFFVFWFHANNENGLASTLSDVFL